MKPGTGGRQAGAAPAGRLITSLVPPVIDGVARLRSSGDAASVHRLRVALARLRVALWLFPEAITDGGDPALDAELKWLRQGCAPLRDWDVFLAASAAAVESADAAALRARIAVERARALAEIRRHLSATRGRRLLRRLRALDAAAVPVGTDGAALLATARARLKPLLTRARRHGRRIETLDDRRLHRLRVRLRRPRYACELLCGHCDPARSDAYREALARLQARLGTIQDATIGERLVARLRGQDSDPGVRVAAAAALARLRRKAKRGRRQAADAWRAFEAAPAFWKPASD